MTFLRSFPKHVGPSSVEAESTVSSDGCRSSQVVAFRFRAAHLVD